MADFALFARAYEKGRMSGSLHLWFCLFDGVDNVRVSRAAAEIPAHEFSNLRLAFSMTLLDARHRRHDLSRRAIAALKCIVVNEGLLHGVQCTVSPGEPLDRRDLMSFHHCDEGQA